MDPVPQMKPHSYVWPFQMAGWLITLPEMGHLNSSGISSSKLSGIRRGEGIHGKDGAAGVGDRSLGSNGDAGDARGSSRSIRYSLASRSKAAASKSAT